MKREYRLLSEEDTVRLGARLGELLTDGTFVALYGDLGAGKTTLVAAAANAMGIRDTASPTFTVVREHKGEHELFHFDAYRLSDSDELYAMGYEDYLDRNGVIMMEWAENVEDALPAERLELHLFGSGADERRLIATARGTCSENILMELNI